MSHMCKMMEGVRKHKGGCHCGLIRFEVTAPSQVTVFECSCSICQKRQSRYFLVDADRFLLLQGHGNLSTFGSSEVKHSFCTTCGVQSFFIPSSGDSTGSVGIMPHCLDPGTLKKIKTKKRSPSKTKENDDPLHRPMASA